MVSAGFKGVGLVIFRAARRFKPAGPVHANLGRCTLVIAGSAMLPVGLHIHAADILVTNQHTGFTCTKTILADLIFCSLALFAAGSATECITLGVRAFSITAAPARCACVPAGPTVLWIFENFDTIIIAVCLPGRAVHAAFALVTGKPARANPPAPATVVRV